MIERTGNEFPVLIGQTGPLEGRRWVIDQTVVIGRDASCAIVVPDRQVSRYHARLMPAPDGIILEDMGSKNGTHCNGARLTEPVVLQDGDSVQIALAQQFVFLSSDATMPLEAGFLPAAEPQHRLRLEIRSRRVWIGNQEVSPSLSVPQFRLLQILFEQAGRVGPRTEVISVVWEDMEAQGVSEQALDALVRRLRDRLSEVDPHHEYVVTVRGYGLRLDNPL
ncbi:MAG TPA: FHA domain-containing protein, partial [Anaerolineaceae bacterium]